MQDTADLVPMALAEGREQAAKLTRGLVPIMQTRVPAQLDQLIDDGIHVARRSCRKLSTWPDEALI